MKWEDVLKQKTYEVYIKDYRNAKSYPSWTKVSLNIGGYKQNVFSREIAKMFFEETAWNKSIIRNYGRQPLPSIVEGDEKSGYVASYNIEAYSPTQPDTRYADKNVLWESGPVFVYQIVEKGEKPSDSDSPSYRFTSTFNDMKTKIENYVRIAKRYGNKNQWKGLEE